MTDNNEQITFKFEELKPIKGYPELRWTGKTPYRSTVYYPAQHKETYGEEKDGWLNEIFWGDNLQVMSHLLKKYQGQIDLIYIDPPFDSKADYKKKIQLKGQTVSNDSSTFEEKQYGDIWTNDQYIQFMYERLILLRELLSNKGAIYVHCDWHKAAYLRCVCDSIFGVSNFRNEIIWSYSTLGRPDDRFAMKHDNILCYGKTSDTFFNVEGAKIPYTEEYIKSHFRDLDENGKQCRRRFDAGKWRTYYPDAGMIPNDVWDIPYENSMSKNRVDYPTQKPEALLERIIKSSSKPGDVVFDCFMGSGTTQAVAMKLGRRFIGADINLGAVQTTTKRLIGVAKDLNSKANNADKYTGFKVYNVNNYDMFRNPLEARSILLQALDVQPFESTSIYDGEKDGRMIKIVPDDVNRIATKADLNGFIANLPYKLFDRRKEENPLEPVLKLTIVCMGHEPDLAAEIKLQLSNYKVDVDIVDILTDRKDLQFKRESQGELAIEDNKLIIKNFYPLNLMQKLSMQRQNVDNWRQLVESIFIDFNYDGAVLSPTVTDIAEKNNLVSGEYEIPENAGKIKVKITDLLSESLELQVEVK